MPKTAPTPFKVDVEGGTDVQCTIKDGLVNVGLNPGWPSSLRFPMKVSKTAGLEQIKVMVSEHKKFAACRAHASCPSASSAASSHLPSLPLKREFDALAKEPQPLTGYYWAAASHAVTQWQQQQPAPSQPKPPIQPAPPSQPVLGHLEFSLGKATKLRESRPTRVPAQHLSLAICQMVPWLFRRCSRRWRATQQCRYVMMVLLKCRSQSSLPVGAANATLRQRCDAVAARRLTFAVRPAPMRRGSTVGSALMARRRRHTMTLLYLCNGRHILLPAGLSCSGPAVHAQLQIARSDSAMGLVRWAMAASSTSAPRRASSGVHVRT